LNIRYPKLPPPAPRLGFTLIELLVALALIGILGTSLAGVLRSATETVEQAQASVNHVTRLRSLDTVLGGALRDAVPLTLLSAERRMLTEQDAYAVEEGTIRFRGEELMLGFCLQRPFLSAERDGYMHWVVLDIQTDEESGLRSLWLRDVSFLPGIDNPTGEDWGGLDGGVEERLPVQTVCLIRDASVLAFRYWHLPEESDGTPEEMLPEELEGDYAPAVPAYIELEIKMPSGPAEVLTWDYSLRETLAL
jgi:prepilin-type N-terminal cleavage/methylation domain-containing protein